MSKPNWACSKCGMYSSRRWSVERHIQNLHQGIGSVIPFVAYLAGIQSGFYVPKFRPTFAKSAVKAVTVMDTFKEELLKGFASKAADKVFSSSPIQNRHFLNFQGFGNNRAPYYPSQFCYEPLNIIPRLDEIFGFEIYVCNKCSLYLSVTAKKEDQERVGPLVMVRAI